MKKWICALISAVALVGCGGGNDEVYQPKTVEYVISSLTGGSAAITYSTASGTAQTTSTLPKSIFWYEPKSGDFLYVSAQTQSSASFAGVTVSIKLNGATIKSTTSTGPFSIATASTSCC